MSKKIEVAFNWEDSIPHYFDLESIASISSIRSDDPSVPENCRLDSRAASALGNHLVIEFLNGDCLYYLAKHCKINFV